MGGKDAKGKEDKGRGAGFNAFQDAVNKETIKKEMQYHKIHEEYVPPPHMKKNWVLADKPNNINVTKIIKDDAGRELEHPPRSKYHDGPIFRNPFDVKDSKETQVTMSEDYGWYPRPLMRDTCPLFCHPRVVTEITLLYGPATGKKIDVKKK
ncbi:hypothetical protein BDR26DRAFT_856746 [Obelidium mucronatum]|nr:hypothetical protein BDR26DRAFT_856746 [Obelidium mucronatum]